VNKVEQIIISKAQQPVQNMQTDAIPYTTAIRPVRANGKEVYAWI